jgi:ubiquinone/menaquinone biosynthesis C-methylase UbiE
MPTDPSTVNSYDMNAEAYNAHVTNPADSVYHAYYEKPAMHAELPSLSGLDVISIGCGSGVDAQYLKDNGSRKVVGIDISDCMITIAKRDHPGIEFSVMDMEKLNFPDNSFGVAYSSLAIHYLEDWTVALKEAHRVLKPSGTFIFSCGHPFDQTWERIETDTHINNYLGDSRDKQDSTHNIYGDYMAAKTNGTKKIVGGLAHVDVVTYHQTFAKMVQYITAAGFNVEKLVEPLPLEEMKTYSLFSYDRLMKIPAFVIWVLRK